MSTTAQKTAEANPFSSLGEALGSAAERFEEGASHARDSAKHDAGSTHRAVKVGLYNAAYGISYGLVFSTVYLTELLPKDSTIRRGLEEGADAAFEAQAKRSPHSSEEEAPAKPKKAKKAKAKQPAKEA